MANTGPESHKISLKYGIPPANGEQAFVKIQVDPATGEFINNYSKKDEDVVIENVRGKEDTVSLDTTGFAFYKHKTKLTPKEFLDDNIVRSEYYPESVELLKKLTGASRVEIFDHSTHSA